MQRVLSVTLSHAVRAAAFVALPFAFLSLIAWATAGSASGSTTDPIRGATWIWLGAHHIPFSLSLPPAGIPGFFSYLPWGAMVIPFLAIRVSFSRALDRLRGDFHDINGVRMAFAIFYALILTAVAYISKSDGVHPEWYYAPVVGWLLAIVAVMTVGSRPSVAAPVIMATRVVSIILGVALFVLGILTLTHIGDVKAITTTLQPGIFGGLLLLFLNILYLPNAAVALISYAAGSGFAVGSGSLISPWWYHYDQLPALPLLGVLPTARHPMLITLGLIFIGLGALVAYWTLDSGISLLLQTFLFIAVFIVLIAYLSSGALITSEMGAFGVSAWKFPLTIFGEMALGAAITTYLLERANR